MGREIKDLIITKAGNLNIEKGEVKHEGYKDLHLYSRWSRSWHLIEDNLITEDIIENSVIVIEDDYFPNELKVVVKGKELEETIDIFWCNSKLKKEAIRNFCEKHNLCFEGINTKEISDLIIQEFIVD